MFPTLMNIFTTPKQVQLEKRTKMDLFSTKCKTKPSCSDFFLWWGNIYRWKFNRTYSFPGLKQNFISQSNSSFCKLNFVFYANLKVCEKCGLLWVIRMYFQPDHHFSSLCMGGISARLLHDVDVHYRYVFRLGWSQSAWLTIAYPNG